MNDNNNVIMELHMVGKDFTAITDCLGDSVVKILKELPKDVKKAIQALFCLHPKPVKNNNELRPYKFLNIKETRDSLKSLRVDEAREIFGNLLSMIDSTCKDSICYKYDLFSKSLRGLINDNNVDTEIKNQIEELLNRMYLSIQSINEYIEKLKGFKDVDLSYNNVMKLLDDDYTFLYRDIEKVLFLWKTILNKIDKQKLILSYKKKTFSIYSWNQDIERFTSDYEKRKSYVEKLRQNQNEPILNHIVIHLIKNFFDNFNLIENEELIVGRRELRDIDLEEKDCRLYSMDNQQLKFGNLVGTVRKEYTCSDFADILKKLVIGDNEHYKLLYKHLKGEDSSKKVALTIQINSRFDDEPSKPYFLLEMLTQGNLRFNSSEILSNDRDAIIFDCLMIWCLKQYLLRAYQKGLFQTYHTFQENGIKPRGSIDFAQHIKMNTGLQNGKVAYTYRDKSVDNYLNHLILEAYECLKKKYHDLVVRNLDTKYEVREVIDLLKYNTNFPKYSRSHLIRKCEMPISHPYFTEYEDLRKICINVLNDKGASLISGTGENVSGILYYIPDLWEEYLESIMQEEGLLWDSQISMDVFYSGSKYMRRLRPDYVFINENNDSYMILDAKYKPGWYELHNGKSETMYYQYSDYDECIRNMNAIEAYATGVIFPHCMSEDDDIFDYNIISHRVAQENDITSFYTIPIIIPCVKKKIIKVNKTTYIDKEYEVWKNEFKKNVVKQIRNLNKLLELEYDKYANIRSAIHKIQGKLYEYNNQKREFCIAVPKEW